MTSDRTLCVSPSCVVAAAAMHRSKTSSGPSTTSEGSVPVTSSAVSPVTASRASTTARRILPKSWRSKQQGKSAPCSPAAGTGNKAFWTPVASNTWCNNISGSRVVLSPASLLHLTEIEQPAAQKAALARLQGLDLGLKINIPKEWTCQKTKKSRFLLKRRVVGSSTALDGFPDSYSTSTKDSSPGGVKVGSGGGSSDGSSGGGSGWVFGVPLAKCIANDAHLRRGGGGCLTERQLLSPLNTPQPTLRNRKSSSSSGGAISCDDSESELSGVIGGGDSSGVSRSSLKSKSSKRRSSLLDALLLSPSTARENKVDTDQHQLMTSSAGSKLLVPYVVTTCCHHLQTYGLGVLGIFRIGSSKKRTTQLREEFDTGRQVSLTEDHNPHEVAALLKEFFRDLPDPLLTRDLYSAFVATRKLKSLERRIEAVNLLIALLPVSNRDTLWALLTFLNLVSKHSTDSLDEHGNTLPGNKMDAHNLATLFGPNILHKAKGGALQFQVESQERAEERVEVIEVVREMIEHQASIFALSAELHDETLRLLMNTNPEVVDHLLRSRTISLGLDVDQESTSSIYDLDGDSSGAITELQQSPVPNRRYEAAPPSPGRPGTLIETLQPPPAGLLSGRSLVEVLQVHAASLAAAARSQPKGGCPSALAGAVLGGVDMSLTAVAIGGQPASVPLAAASVGGSNAFSSAPSTVPGAMSRRCPEMRICITADSPEYSRRHQPTSLMPSTVVASSTATPSASSSSSSSSAAMAPLAIDEIDALESPCPRAHHFGRRSSGVPHGSVRSFEKQKQQQSIQARRQQASSSSRQYPQHTLTVPTKPSSRLDRDSGTSSAGSAGCSSRGSSASPSPSPEPSSPMMTDLVDRGSPRTSVATPSGGLANCSTASPSGGRSLSTQRPLGVLRALQSPCSDNGRSPLQSSSGPVAVDGAPSSSRGCSLHQQPAASRRWDLLSGHHRHQTSRTDELHEQETLV